jgi:hypothetical protein
MRDRPLVPYEQSSLDERKIRDYARKVARELIASYQAEDRWVDRQVTEQVWVDETVTESRWGGLRKVEVTRRVQKPQTVTGQVKLPPPTSWLLSIGPQSTSRTKLSKSGDYGEEQHRTTYYLKANGDLVRSYYYSYDGILDGRYFQGSRTEEESVMSTSDMLWFDRRRDGKVWAPAKGVGLHARLTKLRKTGQ